MPSGRDRIDNLLKTYTRGQRTNPDLLLENSEHPIAPQQREDDPPELNEDTGKAYQLFLPIPQPVYAVPQDVSNYVTQNFHAFTVGVQNNVVKQIAGAQDKRTQLRIKNNSAAGGSSITIGQDPATVVSDGWTLVPGETVTLSVPSPIWAFFTAAVATTVTVQLLAEFSWPVE